MTYSRSRSDRLSVMWIDGTRKPSCCARFLRMDFTRASSCPPFCTSTRGTRPIPTSSMSSSSLRTASIGSTVARAAPPAAAALEARSSSSISSFTICGFIFHAANISTPARLKKASLGNRESGPVRLERRPQSTASEDYEELLAHIHAQGFLRRGTRDDDASSNGDQQRGENCHQPVADRENRVCL